MNKTNIIKNSYEFEEIIKTGKTFKNSFFVVHIKENTFGKTRYGISVGKKIGNAVVRNYMKRQIRNIINKNKKDYQKSLDYIIIMRSAAITLSFVDKEKKLLELFEK